MSAEEMDSTRVNKSLMEHEARGDHRRNATRVDATCEWLGKDDKRTYAEGGGSRFLRTAGNQLPNAWYRILEEHDII